MFELADSGSSGDLPLLGSPLSLSPPFSLSLFHLSTCYATPCHAALAQVCGRVYPFERTPLLRGLHLTPLLSSSACKRHAPSLPRPPRSFAPSFPSCLPSFLPFVLSRLRLSSTSRPIAWAARTTIPLSLSTASRGASEDLPIPWTAPVQEHIVTPSGSTVQTRCTGRTSATEHSLPFIHRGELVGQLYSPHSGTVLSRVRSKMIVGRRLCSPHKDLGSRYGNAQIGLTSEHSVVIRQTCTLIAFIFYRVRATRFDS